MKTISKPPARSIATRLNKNTIQKAKGHADSVRAFRAIVDQVVSGLFAFHKTADDAPAPGDDVETYAKLFTGMAVRPPDDVVVIPFAGTYLMLGRISNTEEGALLESPVASMSPTPSVSPGAALGTGSPSASLRNASNDDFGTLVLVTGTSPTTGVLATITFARPKPNADYAAMWSAGDPDAAQNIASVYTDYISDRSTTSVVLRARAALPAGNSFIFFYTFLTPRLG
jgi:hypothetical protein